jgi:hypothetical protein
LELVAHWIATAWAKLRQRWTRTAPVQPVEEAPAIEEPTPVDPEKDPNAGPDSELAAKPVEAFTMKDDADYKLSSKELDMVASAVGFDLKKKRRKN